MWCVCVCVYRYVYDHYTCIGYVSHNEYGISNGVKGSPDCEFGFLFSLGRMAICLNNLLMILKSYTIFTGPAIITVAMAPGPVPNPHPQWI